MSATRLLFRANKATTGWAALVRRNCTAPALPSCSPFPYCAALARRNGTAPALPSCSPFRYCATLARRNGTDPAFPFVSFFAPRHMYSYSDSKEPDFSLLKRENEKLIRDIEKMRSELWYDIDKDTAGQRLDFNLKRGRMCDELEKKSAEITDLITKLDWEIHKQQALRKLMNALRSFTHFLCLTSFFTVCGVISILLTMH